jgi:hypothetical protein
MRLVETTTNNITKNIASSDRMNDASEQRFEEINCVCSEKRFDETLSNYAHFAPSVGADGSGSDGCNEQRVCQRQ